jgi:formylglycine-generating enzyme required for sulfatase activity/serine/threonine protein kinase
MPTQDKDRFGSYELLDEIGRGGMGVVYRARHVTLGHIVALKILIDFDIQDRARFQREARALATVNHRNVIQISQLGEQGGCPFFVMELIAGVDLKRHVEQSIKETGELPSFEWTCRVFKELAEGFVACQAQGLIHRDIKPANILIEEDSDRPVIIDFGLVKRSVDRARLESFSGALSQSEEVMGTLSYMAPEQADSKAFGPVGYHTDIWGLGATIFYCLTGRGPFTGPTPMNIYKQLMTKEAPEVQSINPKVPVALQQIVAGCLLKTGDRFDLETLLQLLIQSQRKGAWSLSEQPTAARDKNNRLGLIALIALIVLGLLFIVSTLFLTGPSCSVETTVTSHKNGAYLNMSKLYIRGQTMPNAVIEIKAMRQRTRARSDGQFKLRLTLTEGQNNVLIDIQEGQGKHRLSLILDTKKPVIVIDNDSDEEVQLIRAAELTGKVREKHLTHLSINGKNIPLEDGRFKFPITHKKATNYKFKARDKAGNITEREVTFAVEAGILKDRLKWNKADRGIQDLVIKQVDKKLGSAYEWLETKEYSCNDQRHRIATFRHVFSGLEMNLIPGGTFQMGDDNSDSEKERPAHKATIKPMLIGRYEVTQAQWEKTHGKSPSQFKGLDNPVELVSWDDCQSWLKSAGGGLRLPSESEWEYACRSGTTTQYFWGDEMDGSYCWYTKNSGDKTHAVTEHMNKTNAFGLVDMSGNAGVWCQDQWIDNYNNGPRDSRPRTSASPERALRGGGWQNDASVCRSAFRAPSPPAAKHQNIGFRACRTLNYWQLFTVSPKKN